MKVLGEVAEPAECSDLLAKARVKVSERVNGVMKVLSEVVRVCEKAVEPAVASDLLVCVSEVFVQVRVSGVMVCSSMELRG